MFLTVMCKNHTEKKWSIFSLFQPLAYRKKLFFQAVSEVLLSVFLLRPLRIRFYSLKEGERAKGGGRERTHQQSCCAMEGVIQKNIKRMKNIKEKRCGGVNTCSRPLEQQRFSRSFASLFIWTAAHCFLEEKQA